LSNCRRIIYQRTWISVLSLSSSIKWVGLYMFTLHSRQPPLTLCSPPWHMRWRRAGNLNRICKKGKAHHQKPKAHGVLK
jgi:hypothetical protein